MATWQPDPSFYTSPREAAKAPPETLAYVAAFDPATFRDRYEEALMAHLKARQAGEEREDKPAFAAPRPVINLMEALRRSIQEDKKPKPARKVAACAAASAGRKRTREGASRRELVERSA